MGSLTVNVLPFPNSLSTSNVPTWTSIIFLETANSKPILLALWSNADSTYLQYTKSASAKAQLDALSGCLESQVKLSTYGLEIAAAFRQSLISIIAQNRLP